MEQKGNENKKFSVELTKAQVAIIKGGLQYFWLADDYGYAFWRAISGATYDFSDRCYRFKVGDIYEELNKLTKVKPDYGWWGNIKRINKLCKKDLRQVKKEKKFLEDSDKVSTKEGKNEK